MLDFVGLCVFAVCFIMYLRYGYFGSITCALIVRDCGFVYCFACVFCVGLICLLVDFDLLYLGLCCCFAGLVAYCFNFDCITCCFVLAFALHLWFYLVVGFWIVSLMILLVSVDLLVWCGLLLVVLFCVVLVNLFACFVVVCLLLCFCFFTCGWFLRVWVFGCVVLFMSWWIVIGLFVVCLMFVVVWVWIAW